MSSASCRTPLVVPFPVRESEILKFTEQDWRTLDSAGLETYELTPTEVGEAVAVKGRHSALSANDCFCFVAARSHRGILLTGDAFLRRIAGASGLRVHGVLWVIDQLQAVKGCPTSLLIAALEAWQSDDAVFLPAEEIENRLRNLGDL